MHGSRVFVAPFALRTKTAGRESIESHSGILSLVLLRIRSRGAVVSIRDVSGVGIPVREKPGIERPEGSRSIGGVGDVPKRGFYKGFTSQNRRTRTGAY